MPVSSEVGGEFEVLPVRWARWLKRAGIANLPLDTSLYLHAIKLL